MYLEAKFEDGAVGFYPVTASSTITIAEPPANDSTPAQTVAFAAQGIRSLELVDGDLPVLPEHDAPTDITPTLAELIPPLQPDAPVEDPAADPTA